ncbi:glycine betaine ABC transporter substrate-binding protein [uncultured Azohydromonas sp.]|mgnify:CR=1 FL=1|uniref:glycine betaine ABC transporter substrate-binding protein n=1 Tax=uncultured Azohydromonas sp. TaxID=487342 RepID=UPI0026249A72|nr:glycine betaine ABC transporter substrate-binding protein [uncultured Azohydromonas sp.]
MPGAWLWRALTGLVLGCVCAWTLAPAPAPTASGTAAAAPAAAVVVGSKRFTESYLLGELATQVLQRAGIAAQHRQGLGNTGILEQALGSGAIDLYPEYTGTIARELLRREGADAPRTLEQLNALLAPRGLKAAVPLGFNNTYALAMREDEAARLGVTSLSDLARLPGERQRALRFGLSHEFLQRADGWPGLRRTYGLDADPGAGLDHGLAYQALAQGQVDLIDVYTTDAQIGRLRLRVLHDDRNFFPRYDAVLLMRATLDEAPLRAALAGRIDEAAMIAMNARAELDGRPFAEVAREFLDGRAGGAGAAASAPATTRTAPGFMERLLAPDLGPLLAQHLAMVFGSLALAVAVGVPLGVLAHRFRRLAGVLLGAVGVLQTVPSLALLAFLIALVGRIGFVPALLALFVYALLPIVRNTHAGLAGVPPGLRLAGAALGLRSGQVLRAVELPLAAPVMLAGIKTAAVINVGTATVAAFVGAGGLGERIVSGLALNDHTQTLAGAVPAALLALAVQGVFEAVERRLRRVAS